MRPVPHRIRGDEISPPEDDYEERAHAYDEAMEAKFEEEWSSSRNDDDDYSSNTNDEDK